MITNLDNETDGKLSPLCSLHNSLETGGLDIKGVGPRLGMISLLFLPVLRVPVPYYSGFCEAESGAGNARDRGAITAMIIRIGPTTLAANGCETKSSEHF